MTPGRGHIRRTINATRMYSTGRTWRTVRPSYRPSRAFKSAHICTPSSRSYPSTLSLPPMTTFVAVLPRDSDFAEMLVNTTHDFFCLSHRRRCVPSGALLHPRGFQLQSYCHHLTGFCNKTNTISLKPSVSKHAEAECSPPCFPSQKASATVALTSTTALRSWKPLSSTPIDTLQREENAVPFPTAPACE